MKTIKFSTVTGSSFEVAFNSDNDVEQSGGKIRRLSGEECAEVTTEWRTFDLIGMNGLAMLKIVFSDGEESVLSPIIECEDPNTGEMHRAPDEFVAAVSPN